MTWTDLGNPFPLKTPEPYAPVRWPKGRAIPLPPSGHKPLRPFAEVIEGRRSRRAFAALDLPTLGCLLELVSRVRQGGDAALGFPISFRGAPSAGAIHPVHLVLARPELIGWHRYDPHAHTLVAVDTAFTPDEVRSALGDLMSAPKATLIMFVAEPGKSACKYGNPASLVWRDAGTLLGLLSLTAEALNLSFCALGITGDPWSSRFVEQSGLVGVGAAFVGARP